MKLITFFGWIYFAMSFEKKSEKWISGKRKFGEFCVMAAILGECELRGKFDIITSGHKKISWLFLTLFVLLEIWYCNYLQWYTTPLYHIYKPMIWNSSTHSSTFPWARQYCISSNECSSYFDIEWKIHFNFVIISVFIRIIMAKH